MTTVNLVNLVNNTTADANQVMQNFNSVANAVNGGLDDTNVKAGTLTKAIATEGVAPSQTINIPSATDVFGTDNKGFIYGSASFQVTKDGTSANKINVTSGTAWVVYNNALRNVTISPTSFTTSNTSTTYYLDLNPDQTWSFSGLHSSQANYLPVAVITTDSSANVSTITDVRSLYTRLGSNLRAQSLDGLAVTDVLQSRVSPNLVGYSGFEAVSGTATVFSDALTSYTGSSAAPWTVQEGAVSYGASGVTFTAVPALITAGNAAWKPLTGSGGQNLAVTVKASLAMPATMSNIFVELFQDINHRYRASFDGSTLHIYKTTTGDGGFTQLASAAYAGAVSTTYEIQLSLDSAGKLIATLFNSSGTQLQTCNATDGSPLTGGYLMGMGCSSVANVIGSNSSVTAPFADGWSIGGDSRVAWALTTNAISGKYSVSAVGLSGISGNPAYISSSVTLIASTQYTLSGYMNTQNVGPNGAHIDANLMGGGSPTTATVTGTTSTTRYSNSATSGTSGAQSVVCVLKDPGTAVFDDVQLESGSSPTPYIPQIQHPATPVDLDHASTVGLANIVRALGGTGYKVQSGTVSVSVATANTTASSTLTFPAAYGSTPIVLVSFGNGQPNSTAQVVTTDSESTTGCRVNVIASITGTYPIRWVSIGTG